MAAKIVNMLTQQYTIPELESLIKTEEEQYNQPISDENDFVRFKTIYTKVRELKITLHTMMKIDDPLLSNTFLNYAY